MPESIPEIPVELQAPVRALARAAYLFRGFFVQVVERIPFEQILEEQGAVLDLADRTLDLWGAHLGLEVGGLLDVQVGKVPQGSAGFNSMIDAVILPLTDHQIRKASPSEVPGIKRSRKRRKGLCPG